MKSRRSYECNSIHYHCSLQSSLKHATVDSSAVSCALWFHCSLLHPNFVKSPRIFSIQIFVTGFFTSQILDLTVMSNPLSCPLSISRVKRDCLSIAKPEVPNSYLVLKLDAVCNVITSAYLVEKQQLPPGKTIKL